MITIQVHQGADAKPVLLFTGSGTYASYKIFMKIGSIPAILTDTPIATGISPTENSYIVQATVGAGVAWFIIAGYSAGGALVEASAADFYINDTGFSFTSELKAAIFQKLLNASAVSALVSTNIYDNFPRQLTTYPAAVVILGESQTPDGGKQYEELISLKIRPYAQSGATLDLLKDRIIENIAAYSYEGKEAVIHNIVKTSESADTYEGDNLTIFRDLLFTINAERKNLARENT